MMKKETLEIINNSQFKEVYFLMMNMEQTGSNYLKALSTITTINTILYTNRTEKQKNNEILELDIVNEIFGDVVKRIQTSVRLNIVNYETDELNGIVVISTSIAKELLKKGYQIIDIKPNKFDRKRTVFVFAKDEGIKEELLLMITQMKLECDEDKQSLESNDLLLEDAFSD